MKEIVDLRDLSFNSAMELTIDQNVEWLGEILNEFNDECVDLECLDSEFYLKLTGSITRKKDSRFDEVLLFDAILAMQFGTTCVSTGKPIVDTINSSLKAIYIDRVHAKKYELEDEITLIFDNEERELYFYEKFKASLKEVVREHLFLEKNPYPRA